MQLQPKYHVYLDHKGYMIDERTYRASPASLMGTKFSTGRSAYSGLDFWQVGAMTDYIHGMNQKYLIDPSMCMYSEGLDLSRPGEFRLERDLATFVLPAGMGNITAHYRALTVLYLGDSSGKIYSTLDGITFTLEYTAASKIFGFYEIDAKLFATTGSGHIYSKVNGAWSKIGVGSDFPRALEESLWTSGSRLVYGGIKMFQSFKVIMSGDTFHTLELKLSSWPGTVPEDDLLIQIQEEDFDNPGKPKGVSLASFVFSKSSVTATPTWMVSTTSNFSLRANTTYFLVASSAGTSQPKAWQWTSVEDNKAYYEYGNAGYWNGSSWEDKPYMDMYFRIKRDTIKELYYVMVESDYAFGWFDDGIRRSIDGYNWVPEPPDPLWVMPSGEGIPLNAVATPKGFVSGSQRGLWAFIGGSSGYNLWHFPDYTNPDNFKGMDRWGSYAIFSVENQGIYYTEGSQVLPTTLNYLEEGFKFKSCKAIYASGWDIYAAVSNDGTNWYLARSNMNYNPAPKYWWIVKKLSKTPVHIAGWNDQKIYVFYSDNTCEYFNKQGSLYVASGYMESSIIDENLIKIMKLYNNLSLIYDANPVNTNSSIGYRLDTNESYSMKSFVGDGTTLENVYVLPNPTLGNKIQIKVTLFNDVGVTNVSPVVTDITWKYILQKPAEDVSVKNSFGFTIIANDFVEQFTGEVQEPDRETPRNRIEYLNDLRETASKKQVLNFIGADNISEVGIVAEYVGTGTKCTMTIDRTNYLITTVVEGSPTDNQSFYYKDLTLNDVVTEILTWPNYTAEVHQDQDVTRTANDLEPRDNIELLGSQYLMVGTDIHAVILSDQSPSQSKLSIDGRGEDRVTVSLRDV
jgi:hypothetical protein